MHATLGDSKFARYLVNVSFSHLSFRNEVAPKSPGATGIGAIAEPSGADTSKRTRDPNEVFNISGGKRDALDFRVVPARLRFHLLVAFGSKTSAMISETLLMVDNLVSPAMAFAPSCFSTK